MLSYTFCNHSVAMKILNTNQVKYVTGGNSNAKLCKAIIQYSPQNLDHEDATTFVTIFGSFDTLSEQIKKEYLDGDSRCKDWLHIHISCNNV